MLNILSALAAVAMLGLFLAHLAQVMTVGHVTYLF